MKTIVQVKGARFAVEFDHSPEDTDVGCHESVDLCSVCQEGAGGQEDILCFLSVEAIERIEEAIICNMPSRAEDAADHADSMRDEDRYDRMAA